MENPNTWNKCTHLIAETIGEHYIDQNRGVCGLSLPARIYDALLKAGYIKEEEQKDGTT